MRAPRRSTVRARGGDWVLFVDADVRRTTLRAHRTITRAIQAQDPDAAARRMSRHVHSYALAVMEVEDRAAVAVPES